MTAPRPGEIGKYAFTPLLIILALILSLVPAFRIAHFVFSHGENAVSNDTFVFSAFLQKTLAGHYEWRNFFRDTFVFGHCLALPALLLLVFAQVFTLNFYAIVLFGILLSLTSLFLLFQAMTEHESSPWKWVLLPLLSAFLFAPSTLSTYEFEISSLADGLFYLGFSFGIWALLRYPGRLAGIIGMLAGGLIASWSLGRGPLLWPVFLLLLVLLGEKKKGHYLLWMLGAVIAALPYFNFLILYPVPGQNQAFQHTPTFSSFAQALGFPVAKGFATDSAIRRGWVGLTLGILVIVVLAWAPLKNVHKKLAPGIAFFSFALLAALQTAIFRDGVAPWYSRSLIAFWIGLSCLTWQLWIERKQLPTIILALSFAAFFLSAYYYVTSNQSLADKSFFTRYRSPAAMSCLLDYASAPVPCNNLAFCWEFQDSESLQGYVAPMAEAGLAMFSKTQRRSLQGDAELGRIQTFNPPGIPPPFWSADLSNTQVPTADFRRLNLLLHSPNALEWRVTLPKDLKSAEFHSAIAISASTPHEAPADGVLFELSLKREGQAERVLYKQFLGPEERQWREFSVSLTEFAGQTVTLRLASSAMGNVIHDWAMYRHPYVEWTQNQSPRALSDSASNRLLSESSASPSP